MEGGPKRVKEHTIKAGDHPGEPTPTMRPWQYRPHGYTKKSCIQNWKTDLHQWGCSRKIKTNSVYTIKTMDITPTNASISRTLSKSWYDKENWNNLFRKMTKEHPAGGAGHHPEDMDPIQGTETLDGTKDDDHGRGAPNDMKTWLQKESLMWSLGA
jgi:hypothetical protein